jgi:hypothetical protein
MRAEFQGGACDGHSHSVGPAPPATLSAPCRSAVRGRYVRAETQPADGPNRLSSVPQVIVYHWEPAVEPATWHLSAVFDLDRETG